MSEQNPKIADTIAFIEEVVFTETTEHVFRSGYTGEFLECAAPVAERLEALVREAQAEAWDAGAKHVVAEGCRFVRGGERCPMNPHLAEEASGDQRAAAYRVGEGATDE